MLCSGADGLRVFENEKAKKAFERERYDVAGEWRII